MRGTEFVFVVKLTDLTLCIAIDCNTRVVEQYGMYIISVVVMSTLLVYDGSMIQSHGLSIVQL